LHRQRQFQTAATRRSFFDRKVLKYGYSRTIALGKVVPKDWRYVRVVIISKDRSKIVLELTKLLGDEPSAQTQKTDTRRGQDA
jgi:hypothetical protein